MTRINARSLRRLAIAGCALLLASRVVVGQGPGAAPTVAQRPAAASPYFSAADALEISTFAVGDLSDDANWLALTQSVRRDASGNAYRHDGDPTYVKPTPIRLWAVDAHRGQRQAVFPDKRPVRAARWSPDGSQLAMLAYDGDVFEPVIWTRATGRTMTLKLPVGKYVAETSNIRWTHKGG